MTARQDITAAAQAHGWTLDTTSDYHDRFLRPVAPAGLPPVLARFYEVTDHGPLELVYVGYDSLGRVRQVSTAGPWQQSAITGAHVSFDDLTGPHRAWRVRRVLAAGVELQAVGVV